MGKSVFGPAMEPQSILSNLKYFFYAIDSGFSGKLVPIIPPTYPARAQKQPLNNHWKLSMLPLSKSDIGYQRDCLATASRRAMFHWRDRGIHKNGHY